MLIYKKIKRHYVHYFYDLLFTRNQIMLCLYIYIEYDMYASDLC